MPSTDLFSSLFFAIFAPVALAPLCLLVSRRTRSRTAWIALAGAAFSVCALLSASQGLAPGGEVLASRAWVPSLGLDFSLRLDGLSLFFGLLVSGMGCFVSFYSRYYLDERAKGHGRFYALLLLFMSAMLGTVLADDLLLLFICWELTGLSSFLLIGFRAGESKESAYGARRALLVTLGTGLGLLAGALLIHSQLGTTRLSLLLAQPQLLAQLEAPGLVLGLLLLGALGKSAQVPFQFWLPGAMAAPTPVSAYLHSATLVKLGVFLAARLYPLFHDQALFSPLLLGFGGASLLLGAGLALTKHDLKAVLAYTTVAQLGALLLWYGLAPMAGISGVQALGLLHILSHVLYKGSLFMQAGILDHVAGTRDLRKLKGLARHLPLSFIAALLACASMAGLPGSLGFVSKEVFLGTALQLVAQGQGWGWPVLISLVLGAAGLVAVALRLGLAPWLGALPPVQAQRLHHAKRGFQMPALLLSLAALVLGLLPSLAWGWLAPWMGIDPLFQPVSAFHGFNNAFFLTLLSLGSGALLYWRLYLRQGVQGLSPLPDHAQALDQGVLALVRFARRCSTLIRVDRPADYLSVVIGSCVVLLGAGLALLPLWPEAAVITPSLLEGLVMGLMAGAALGVVLLEKWATRLIALGTVGFLVCFYFMLHKAPDLALTQMLIESTTLILLLLLLGRFSQGAEADEKEDRRFTRRKGLSLAVSVGMGLVVFFYMLHMLAKPHPRKMGQGFLEETLPLALGNNAVNTVLVDFRGFDTMFEITVLAIAALGCLGLLMRWKEKGGGA